MENSLETSFVHIERLTKRFGAVTAVDAVDLRVGRGEFFSLLGPSGCGKTTLLRMIAGFDFPTEGEIFIDATRMTDLPPHKRPSNMVFQSYAIFPHLNVFDNIAYGLRRQRLPRMELDKRVSEALALIKLDGFGDRRADQLSGGERQRVALARALICQPKVLLLDEPLGALDKRLREAMQIELRELQRSLGITFVFVTHDQEEALSMSDRVAVMVAGRILQIAEPRILYEHPGCREVADFIGTMNFFEGNVRGREGEHAIIDAGPLGQIRIQAPLALAPAGAAILLAIRPEKIEISSQSAQAALGGTIVSSAYLGERIHFNVAVEGLKHAVSVAAQGTAPGVGTAVHLSWAPDAMIVLPRG